MSDGDLNHLWSVPGRTTSGISARATGSDPQKLVNRTHPPNPGYKEEKSKRGRNGHFPIKIWEIHQEEAGGCHHQTAEAFAAAEVFFHGVLGFGPQNAGFPVNKKVKNGSFLSS